RVVPRRVAIPGSVNWRCRTRPGRAVSYTGIVKAEKRARSILHVDLDPFLVSVERSLDPSLKGRPVIVGGDSDGSGIVAAVSAEAKLHGVKAGDGPAGPPPVPGRRLPAG